MVTDRDLPALASARSDFVPPSDGVSLPLPAEPTSAARARRFVGRHSQAHGLGGPDDTVRDTAVLLTSELVTNAVVHGRSGVCVTVYAAPGHLLVEVADDNPRLPHALEPERESLNGRGLPIVCALADACGTYPRGQGKVVWFELDRHPASV